MIRPARGALRTVVGLAVVLTLALPAAGAAADDTGAGVTSHTRPGPPAVVSLTVSSKGFTIPGPNPRPSGLTTFRVETAEAGGTYFALLRPKPGATFEQMKKAFDDAESRDPAVSLQGLRDQYRYVDFSGGAGVFQGRPVTFTERLEPGRYYALAASPLGGAHMETLDVSEESVAARPPRFDGIIRYVQTGGGARVIAPSRLPAGGTFLVRNDSALPQEAVFVRIPEDATYDTLQAYFTALRAGKELPPNPLLETTAGLLAIEPGRSAWIHVDFTPGKYSVLSFLAEPEHGVQQAYLGLHDELHLEAR
ncbi:hypothetical protein [Sphaerisporangium fuscum]|uniref:hypothetical protein n=1 Tax=Sphaerisporangium fuscum TaxID=2835868 RepID=UPI001BDD4A3F|nr:hypothetical protein [Sphaerisporangium fuscum]